MGPIAGQWLGLAECWLGLSPTTHLQLPQVPGPGEEAQAAPGVLQQELLFLDSKGTGQLTLGRGLGHCSGAGGRFMLGRSKFHPRGWQTPLHSGGHGGPTAVGAGEGG